MRPERARPSIAAGALALAALTSVGCSGAAAHDDVKPYSLTELDDGINLVVLTPDAGRRLAMETAPVGQDAVGGESRLTVPYAALIYDNTGGTWVYVEPEPLTYLRTSVAVDFIEGDTVYLHDGPELGSAVAVTSVAELYGTDTGVGK